MYLRTSVRRRLRRLGEVMVVIAASFVAFAPKLDQWGMVQPLLDLIA